MTIYVSLLNTKERIIVQPRKLNEKISKRDSRSIILNNGKNVITFNKNIWDSFSIEFKENSNMVLSIDKIVLSQHKIAEKCVLWVFMSLLVVFGIFWYLFVFKNLRNWLKVRPKILLILIIVLQIGQILFYTTQKKDYFGDEAWIFMQQRGNYKIQLQKIMSKDIMIKNDQTIKTAFIMPQENKWKYNDVYDVIKKINGHPPFFHFQVHTIASFVGHLTKWFVFVNIFWFILTMICLYMTSKFLFKNSLLALLPGLLWGFSSVAVSMTLLIRMYAAVTFFAIWLLYLIYRIFENEKLDNKFYICLALNVFFGFLTHYYFLVWVVLLTSVLIICLYLVKRYNDIKKYVIAIFCGFAANFIFWPYSIGDILYSTRGVEAQQNMFNLSDLTRKVAMKVKLIDAHLFSNLLQIWVIILLFIFLFFVLKKVLKNIEAHQNNCLYINPSKIFNIQAIYCRYYCINRYSFEIIILVITTILCLILISKVAPYNTIKYISLSLPAISLLFVVINYEISNKVYFKRRNFILSMTVLAIIFVGLPYKSNLEHFQPIDRSVYVQNYKDAQCVYILKNTYAYTTPLHDVIEFTNDILYGAKDVQDDERIKKLKTILAILDSSQNTIVYIERTLDTKEIFKVIESAGFRKPKFFYRAEHSNAYIISKQSNK
jgi:hypothetical protein